MHQTEVVTLKDSSNLVQVAQSYIPALVAGDSEALARLVGKQGKIEDHKFGRIEGAESVAEFVSNFRQWLSDWTIEKAVHLRTTHAESRVISEDIIFLESPDGEKIEWPFATVACSADGGEANDLYIYYTIWPIIKQHTKRPVIFSEPQIDTKPAPLLQAYHKCLTSGDMEGLNDIMTADAYIRESSGPPYVHWGMTNVIRYFRDSLFKDGAPMMRTERLTSDGRCTFIEFTVIGWDDEPWPESNHQAGGGIWELNADDLLSAVRVYDDIEF
jgi:hypothetical protein